MAAAVVLASCTGSSPSTVPIDAEAAHQLMLTGVNFTGILAPTDAWVEVAQRGCREGAWDYDVAERLGQEAVDVIGSPLPAFAVWMLTVQACHDRFPQDALKKGPPPMPSG